MRSRISIMAAGGSTYRVTVEEGATRSVHEVTVTPQDIVRYAPQATAARLIRASFQFLLEREATEALLSRFDLATIERYFPEYPKTIHELL